MDPVRRWRLPAPETRTHTEVAQAPRFTSNAKHSTEATRLQPPRPCSTLWPGKSACDQATALPHGPVQGACTSKEGESNPQRQSTLRTTLCKIPKACQVSPSSRGSPLSKTGQSHETKYSSGMEEFVCSPSAARPLNRNRVDA
jgi:hypothetical protein